MHFIFEQVLLRGCTCNKLNTFLPNEPFPYYCVHFQQRSQSLAESNRKYANLSQFLPLDAIFGVLTSYPTLSPDSPCILWEINPDYSRLNLRLKDFRYLHIAPQTISLFGKKSQFVSEAPVGVDDFFAPLSSHILKLKL